MVMLGMKILDQLIEVSQTIYRLNKAYVKNKSSICLELLEDEKKKEEALLDSLTYEDYLKMSVILERKYNLNLNNHYLLEVVKNLSLDTSLLSLFIKLYRRYSFYSEQKFTCFTEQELIYFVNNPYFKRYVKENKIREYLNFKAYENYLEEKEKITYDDRYLLMTLKENITNYKNKSYEPCFYLYRAIEETLRLYCEDKPSLLDEEYLKVIKALLKTDRYIVEENILNQLNNSLEETLDEKGNQRREEILLKLSKYRNNLRTDEIMSFDKKIPFVSQYVSFSFAQEYELAFYELLTIETQLFDLYMKIYQSKEKAEKRIIRDQMYDKLSLLTQKEENVIHKINDQEQFLYYIENCYAYDEEDILPCYLFDNDKWQKYNMIFSRIRNNINYNLSFENEIDENFEVSYVDDLLDLGSVLDLFAKCLFEPFNVPNNYENRAFDYFKVINNHFFNSLFNSQYKDLAVFYTFTDDMAMKRLILSDFELPMIFDEKPFNVSLEEKINICDDIENYAENILETKGYNLDILEFYVRCTFDYLGLKKNTLERKYGTIKKHKKEDKDE